MWLNSSDKGPGLVMGGMIIIFITFYYNNHQNFNAIRNLIIYNWNACCPLTYSSEYI